MTGHGLGRSMKGESFGRWTVLAKAYVHERQGVYWRCRCKCGVVRDVRGYHLRAGATKSCGCLVVKHGHNRVGRVTREYRSWQGMMARCENRNTRDFVRYGGRGIKVCKRWRNSFPLFLADMGHCPP